MALRCEEAQIPENSVMDGAFNQSFPAHSEAFPTQPWRRHTALDLLPDAQRHQGLIQKEFAVNGSDLLVSVPDELPRGVGVAGVVV